MSRILIVEDDRDIAQLIVHYLSLAGYETDVLGNGGDALALLRRAPADLVVLDAPDPVTALRTVAPVLMAYKRGRRTVTREPVRLHRPS